VSRRAFTTLLTTLLAVVLAALGAFLRVPYVTLSPGPAFNTLGTIGTSEVLKITGGRTYPTDGALDATTVSVTDHVTLFEALWGWVSSSDAVVPRELVYPPDQDRQQTDQQNAQDMRHSQDDATVAAMKVLGIAPTQVAVAAVTAGGPSDGRLQVGDVLASVDGTPVGGSTDALRRLISARAPGRTVVIGYARGGKPGRVTLRTVATPDAEHRAVIGVQIAPGYPVKVDIKLQNVGGPSAGLMFALGIVDKLQPGSLTGGRVVAGTGEISPDGKVGAIGGIGQKMRGARQAQTPASVFLVPAANCVEAKRTRPEGLQLIKVSTLQGALAALKTLREGGTPPTC
jgi:PDZ domain-containing protein